MRSTARPVSIPVTAELFRGALEFERTPVGIRPHRLPAAALAQARDPQLAMAEAQPSGVRLVAETEASSVELTALATRFAFLGLPARPPGVFELTVDGRPVARASLDSATTVSIDPATGARESSAAEPTTIVFDDLPAGPKLLEIWLPHTETVEIAGLRADAALHPAQRRHPRWLHHGSSISHGTGAEHPLGTWPAVAAAAGGYELVNLGFSGSALLDPFTARAIRDTPAEVISLKLGINLVNLDLMRLRAFGPAVHGFLDTVREGHPDTPLFVVSPIHCPIHEDTPGPGAFDPASFATGRMRFVATGDPAEVPAGKLTLRVVREHLARIVAERSADDPNLRYVDGLSLYGPDDAELYPLPDDLHPAAITHVQMGERFAAQVLAGRGTV
ncbi:MULTISPECIES: GDSL-type esterase/lipase family protein [Pseudonocardia]|uniref:SGNH hydrolase-type esterase domain-containing protein n=2 Tax=Pseudonocardia TaxID=1847 RepID=A0A1Y2N795_PSEAH|nr:MULTISPECIES: SGNH/GDSL hydrolase family protein [Pseudonocardia]OSY43340.1 hypothetical protein BG845_00945 [Pseudonocardia autotrophica]TDN71827.1 GDSL-like lipase/acylhydrolase family protein [Pseudonocardia autotrophica]BBG02515.1 lipase [Pseudonocardia autotrophica]GEC26904.1 lipase [Pseudonocardia saturnea]